MARFTLVVRPDGQALLTTRERLSAEVTKQLGEVLDGWSEGRYPIAVVGECDVVRVEDLDIELERTPAAVS